MYLRALIFWCYKKQLVIALSTCEVEYITSALSACQIVWLMNLLQELKLKVSKSVRLMINNKSTISLDKDPMLHGRSKHIDTKYHFLCNQVQHGMLEVVHINTQKQLTYVLTKVIKTKHFINLRMKLALLTFNLEYELRNSIKYSPNSRLF